MAQVYQLKAPDQGVPHLERDIRKFLGDHNATLVTRIEQAGFVIEVHETKGQGAYLYLQSPRGNVMPVNQGGQVRDHCAAQISLVGFDEQRDHFRDLIADLDSTLAKYFIK